MFWKKQRTSFDIIVPGSDTKRRAFRFTPGAGKFLDIFFMGKKVRILNISAGGISFKNKGFKENDADVIEIDMGDCARKHNPVISLRTRILSIDENDICHTEFDALSDDEEDILHCFVYELQKEQLRNHKQPES